MEKIKFLNTYVNNLSLEEAVEAVEKLIREDRKSYIVAVNVDVIIKIEKDAMLKELTDKADIVLVDGKPLVWASKIYKIPIKEKVSGSDLVPKLCEVAAQRGYTVFILGGAEGIAKKAKEELEKKLPDIIIKGTYSPPLGFEKNEKEIEKINRMISDAYPDLLITCFGCPKQEKFIYQNINNYNARVSICAGATVDFLAGNVKRAPKWMSNHGLEWFYRFLQEPKRMFKRYFIDDIKIFELLWKYR